MFPHRRLKSRTRVVGRKLTFVPACPLQVGETVAAGLDAGYVQNPGIQKNSSQIHQRPEEQREAMLSGRGPSCDLLPISAPLTGAGAI